MLNQELGSPVPSNVLAPDITNSWEGESYKFGYAHFKNIKLLNISMTFLFLKHNEKRAL